MASGARSGLPRCDGPNLSVTAGAPSPFSMPTSDTIRIAAMSDVHYSRTSQGLLQSVFSQVTDTADILVIAGDLTDYGLADEARVLARDLTTTVKIPVVGVL